MIGIADIIVLFVVTCHPSGTICTHTKQFMTFKDVRYCTSFRRTERSLDWPVLQRNKRFFPLVKSKCCTHMAMHMGECLLSDKYE